MKTVAKDNDTLDIICFKHYKTLEKSLYQKFLFANVKLLRKKTLNAGDEVNLPEIKIKQTSQKKYLWE